MPDNQDYEAFLAILGPPGTVDPADREFMAFALRNQWRRSSRAIRRTADVVPA